MRQALPALLLIALLPAAAFAAPAGGEVPVPEIPYQKYVLGNGLTLVVHEDHKAPIVAVNVWYHVGSRTRSRARPASPTCSSTSCSTAARTSTTTTSRCWRRSAPRT